MRYPELRYRWEWRLRSTPEHVCQSLEGTLPQGKTQGGRESAYKGVGGRLKVARVHVARRDARLFAGVSELAEQGRLAYAAGPEDVEHFKRQFVSGERGSENIQFGNPSDEPAVALRVEAIR